MKKEKLHRFIFKENNEEKRIFIEGNKIGFSRFTIFEEKSFRFFFFKIVYLKKIAQFWGNYSDAVKYAKYRKK